MTKHYFFFLLLSFIFGEGIAQTQKNKNVEQSESFSVVWNEALKYVQTINTASDEDFEGFIRFDANQILLMKAQVLSEARKTNFDAATISRNIAEAKNALRLLYGKYVDIKRNYQSTITEYAHPVSLGKKLTSNPCDSNGCDNIGFENGNFNGWNGYYAMNYSNTFIYNITGGPLGAVTQACNDSMVIQNMLSYYSVNLATDYQLSITSGGYDYVVPSIPRVSPWGGHYSAMLGDSQINGQGVAILSKTFLVTPSTSNLTYQYALFLQQPNHPYSDQPFFCAVVLDQNGDTIPSCGKYNVVSGYNMAGFDSLTYDNPHYLGIPCNTKYTNWTTVNVPLSNYVGQCVTIVFEVADCSEGGHFGYAYIDANCSPLTIITSSPNFCGQDSILLTAPPTTTYSWSGPLNGIRGSDSTQNIWIDSTGTYSVVCSPISGATCADTLTITIGKVAGPAPHPTCTANTVCSGQTIQFTNTSSPIGGTFDWDFYNVNYYNDTNILNPSWLYPAPGTYKVKMHEMYNGCGADTFLNVTVDTAVYASIGYSGSCVGFAVYFYGYNNAHTYLWNFGDPSSGPLDTSTTEYPSHTYNTLGTYTVTLAFSNGYCNDTISETISIVNYPVPVITGKNVICPGEYDTLTVRGGYTNYSWAANDSIVKTLNDSTIIVDPTVSILYQVSADNGLCEGVQSFLVNVRPNPTITISATPQTIVMRDSTLLVANSNEAASYYWLPSGSVRSPNADSTWAKPMVSTTYSCNITTACKTFTDSVLVTVNCFRITTTSTSSYCASYLGTVTATPSLGAPPYTYSWAPGGQTSDTISGLSAGIYTVTINDSTGCSVTTTDTVKAGTILRVRGNPSTIYIGDSCILSARCNIPATFSWAPSGYISNPLTDSTFATPTVTTTFTCTVTTACGTFTDSVTITVLCVNHYVQPICIVTVDTANSKCEIIWSRTNSPPDSGYYNIYRYELPIDTTFTYIYSQPLDSLTEYVDIGSYPLTGPVSYELSTVDSCGESALSAPHTSIYLSVTTGVNAYILNWTTYMGFIPTEYRIFRGPALNAMVQIDSVPYTVLTYTDSFPPLNSYYAVEAVNPSGVCIPTAGYLHGHLSATLSGSFSNGFNTIILGVSNLNNSISNLIIYPDPSNGNVTLNYFLNKNSNVAIDIINELGQIAFSKSETRLAGNVSEHLGLEGLSSGVYSLRVKTTGGINVRKLVIIRNR